MTILLQIFLKKNIIATNSPTCAFSSAVLVTFSVKSISHTRNIYAVLYQNDWIMQEKLN